MNAHKEREPRIVNTVTGPTSKNRPPIRPRGTKYEFWSGVLGIDRGLSIHDGGMVAAHISEISKRDRRVLARYMIALWKRFEIGK